MTVPDLNIHFKVGLPVKITFPTCYPTLRPIFKTSVGSRKLLIDTGIPSL